MDNLIAISIHNFRSHEPEAQKISQIPSMSSEILVDKENHEILLATAVVNIISENGYPISDRLILHNGSECILASGKFGRILNNES